MPQLLQAMPGRSVRHERPECSKLGPRPWQQSAANNIETQSEPADSAALVFIKLGVSCVILAVSTAMLGFVMVKLLKADAALRTFVQWTLMEFLFVYWVLFYRAVKRL